MRSRKTLLYLTAGACHACTWHNGTLSPALSFPHSSEGLAAFASHIRTCRIPAIMLADLIEEDFRHERLPHLRGRERSVLIRRKLDQYYRGTPFRHAEILPRPKEGKSHDDVMFSALTNPEHITPWLDILMEHGIALGGIHSVPGISVKLARRLPEENLLLVSWEACAGLRQTYFDSGQLRFSRLTPMDHPGALGIVIETEATRIQHYLGNMSLLPPEAPLGVYTICTRSIRDTLQKHLCDSPLLRYRYLDIHELGRMNGAKITSPSPDAMPLFLHLSASHPKHSHYATSEHTRFMRLSHIRRILHGLSAAAATAGLLWSTASISAGVKLHSDTQPILKQANLAGTQAQQIIQALPVSLAPVEHMKSAVLLARALEKHSPPPQAMLGSLSRVLEAFPQIRVTKLSWHASPSVESTLSAGAQSACTHQIELEGEVPEFSGGYSQLQIHMEHFRQALQQQGYGVAAMSLPFEDSTNGNISSGTNAYERLPASISLKLEWSGNS